MGIFEEVERSLHPYVQGPHLVTATRVVLQRVRDSLQIRQPYTAAQVHKLLDDAIRGTDAP